MTQASTNLTVAFCTIDAEHVDQRIDNYLFTHLKGVPKSRIYRLLRKGEVRVNKKRIKPEYKLQKDDVVRIPPVRQDARSGASSNVNLGKVKHLESCVLYEDKSVIVLNKPQGVAVHGGSGLSFGVIEALRALRPDERYLELVHRLDRDTSGCLLIAKKRSMLRHLHAQLQAKSLSKVYHALVHGRWHRQTDKVDLPLLKNHLKSGERLVKVDSQGKKALTRFRLLETFDRFSLIEAMPITGRTHQIRVHCLSQGHPIAGDAKYCPELLLAREKDCNVNRLFLHAASIGFDDLDGKRHRITAAYDAQMVEQLKQQGSQGQGPK